MLTVDYDRLGVGPGTRVLDVGCGKGRHTFEALRRGAAVVAADLDRGALSEVAVMTSAMADAGDVPPSGEWTCVATSALDLPFADSSFDVVIASEVLEHIPDDLRALREIERVLSAAGIAAMSVPRRWPERICWSLSDEYHEEEGGHVRIYRARDLKARIERAGLRVTATHHAHALHSPYWWIKCAFGVENTTAKLPSLYHRFLVWDITHPSNPVRNLERALSPILGKSLVVYSEKPHARA